MNAELLRQMPTIQEFFKLEAEGELPEGTRLLLEAMTEIHISKDRILSHTAQTVTTECTLF